MKKAIKLLPGTRLPSREMAPRCGCTCSNYFSRTFREKMNCTPEEFRRAGITNMKH